MFRYITKLPLLVIDQRHYDFIPRLFVACKGAIREMDDEIKKIDPRKRVEVSGFRLDPSGKSKSKTVQYSKSETYLTELMESVCKSRYILTEPFELCQWKDFIFEIR